jgi:hypothetical protein
MTSSPSARVSRLRTSIIIGGLVFATGLLVATATPPLQADQALTMRVSPAQSFAPATLRVRVRLEPHADNHSLELIIDSPDYYRSSLVPLDGERSPRTMVLDFKGCPGGEYQVVSLLTDRAGRERASATQHVMVVSQQE